jgi:phage recombination protein Bet
MNAIAQIERPQTRSVLMDMASRYGMEPAAFEATVRATCTPANTSREEFAAFLLVAKEYNLNPLTKEIYAFPKRGGGIVPIVSVDGWTSLVNSHGACDGFEFDMEHDDKGELVSCTCRMFRKDRSRPVTVTEYLSECVRPTDPWKMKHRMLRHKAMIQAARYAFGFSGIYDEDEAAKIEDVRESAPLRVVPPPPPPPAIEHKPAPAAPPAPPPAAEAEIVTPEDVLSEVDEKLAAAGTADVLDQTWELVADDVASLPLHLREQAVDLYEAHVKRLGEV